MTWETPASAVAGIALGRHFILAGHYHGRKGIAERNVRMPMPECLRGNRACGAREDKDERSKDGEDYASAKARIAVYGLRLSSNL